MTLKDWEEGFEAMDQKEVERVVNALSVINKNELMKTGYKGYGLSTVQDIAEHELFMRSNKRTIITDNL